MDAYLERSCKKKKKDSEVSVVKRIVDDVNEMVKWCICV